MSRDNDNQELIRQLKHGDERATDRMVALFGGRLSVAARRLCGNETDARDLTDETLREAYFSIGSFREESSLFSWLCGIMRNIYRMSARKWKRSRVVSMEHLPEIPADGPPVGQRIDDQAASDCLEEALRKLPKEQQDVVLMRYFGELNIRDIAFALELRPGTVKSRLYYAVRRLKKYLPEELGVSASARNAR